MKYGIHVPNFGAYDDAKVLADLARDAEQAGWDGFFLWDHVAQGWLDTFVDTTVALTAIALKTERIQLGPLITPLARRRPAKLARETVSLDRLSSGRLILGVGLGIVKEEFDDLGDEADPKTRGAMLDEGLEVLTQFWQGKPVTHAGTHFTVKDVQLIPTPVQQPRIPVWVAGTWPNQAPFRRAARWDGAFPLGVKQSFIEMMPVADMKACIDFMRTQRTSDAPFEVAHWGVSKDERDRAAVEPYAEVGVTWWLENVNPWVFGWHHNGAWPVEMMRERILRGPARI